VIFCTEASLSVVTTFGLRSSESLFLIGRDWEKKKCKLGAMLLKDKYF